MRVLQVTLALFASGQVNGQLAAEHLETVGVFERTKRRFNAREQNVRVVVFFERALDHLAVLAEQLLDLALAARERKVGHRELIVELSNVEIFAKKMNDSGEHEDGGDDDDYIS
ncbi:hypothetical protein BpHYR1_054064 [Brachionus plicatilis]|uniref:Secreted protein n=1 Tax=Brachionus plicatilis TaxID=10195 RepID=A0A3M7RCE1_BRAPC|nr:hypothetical protein BpHYR1_054064 [Brachionus plicatilis]